jgi:hypothetical protein
MSDAEAIFGASSDELAARLHQNRTANSTTPDAERDYCPECGTKDLQPTNSKPIGPTPDAAYRCRGCGAAVDEPVSGGDAA